MIRAISLCLTALSVITAPIVAQGSLPVKPDRQNVVASRLAGDWEIDSALTNRLGARFGGVEGVAARSNRASFKSDSTIAQRLPKWLVDAVAKDMPTFRIFMAGTANMFGTTYPFLLVELSGNMQVMVMQPRGNDPLGDGESFIVQLAVAREPMNDLLLIGGDFNNQPFMALKRTGAPPTGGGPPLR